MPFELESPVRRPPRRATREPELLAAANALAAEGRHPEALAQVLAYLFPGEPIPDLTREAFQFVQGSSRVHVRLDGDDVVLTVPLVRLPPGDEGTPALRYILGKLGSPLQLYQPRLSGDDVRLELREPLARVHPEKIVDVLAKMPADADESDEILIVQHGAIALDRVTIAPLSDDELALADRIWRRHWRFVRALTEEARLRHSMFFLDALTEWAYHRPLDALPITGLLRARLDAAASRFNDTMADPVDREDALAMHAERFAALPESELAASLGHATFGVDPVPAGTPATLSMHLGEGPHRERVEELLAEGDGLGAALDLIAIYTFLLAEHAWEPETETALRTALLGASGKEWNDAARDLLVATRDVVGRFGGALCPWCGTPLTSYFCEACGGDRDAASEVVDHPLVSFVSRVLEKEGIDPIATRRSAERWAFTRDGAQIVVAIAGDHLAFSSPVAKADPTALRRLLAEEHAPLAFDLDGDIVRLALSLHVSDVRHGAHEELAARVERFLGAVGPFRAAFAP